MVETGVLLGYLYVMGGVANSRAVDSTFRFDPDSNSWQELAPLNQPKWNFCLVPHDKHLYAIGGLVPGVTLKTVERFNPASNSWRGLAAMSEPRAKACGVALGGSIFIFGGKAHGQPLRSCEKYCIGTNQWEQIASMPSCRIFASAVAFKGSIYVFGGRDGLDKANEETFTTYDPDSDKWQQGGKVPICCQRYSSAAVLRLPRSIIRSNLQIIRIGWTLWTQSQVLIFPIVDSHNKMSRFGIIQPIIWKTQPTVSLLDVLTGRFRWHNGRWIGNNPTEFQNTVRIDQKWAMLGKGLGYSQRFCTDDRFIIHQNTNER